MRLLAEQFSWNRDRPPGPPQFLSVLLLGLPRPALAPPRVLAPAAESAAEQPTAAAPAFESRSRFDQCH